MFACQANGSVVKTVEGISEHGELSDLQAAFKKHHALQCGFCTPGMLTTLVAVLEADPTMNEQAIREAISGNICRCTGYESIVDAALQAAAVMRGGH